MRLVAALIPLSFLTVALSLHASEEAEKFVQELVTTLESVETKLKKVDSKDTAGKALPDIKQYSKQVDQFRDRSEKLNVDPKVEEELLKKYKDKLFGLGTRIGKEMSRLEGVDGAKEVVEEMKKLVDKVGLPTEEPKEKKK